MDIDGIGSHCCKWILCWVVVVYQKASRPLRLIFQLLQVRAPAGGGGGGGGGEANRFHHCLGHEVKRSLKLLPGEGRGHSGPRALPSATYGPDLKFNFSCMVRRGGQMTQLGDSRAMTVRSLNGSQDSDDDVPVENGERPERRCDSNGFVPTLERGGHGRACVACMPTGTGATWRFF